MSNSAVQWKETISRGTAIALMHNFVSVAEALKELVDNPIDYRQGQKLIIEITEDKRNDRLIVESDGGRGMGAEEIQVWLNWGEGEEHSDSDIGRWHQGGKAACGFLGRHVRLWSKRLGSPDVWFLEDENWGSRREPKDYGVPSPLTLDQQPDSIRQLPLDRGHVRLEVSKLNREKRWNLEVLKREISNTYRQLLLDGDLVIRVKGVARGEPIDPLEIPLSTSSGRIDLEVNLPGGRRVSGWAGRLQRHELTSHLKSGLRLVHNGRLIKEGEWFGYKSEGKGSLNSLIGELDFRRFTPSPNKTDFVERGDEVWDELSKKILEQLARSSPNSGHLVPRNGLARLKKNGLTRSLTSWRRFFLFRTILTSVVDSKRTAAQVELVPVGAKSHNLAFTLRWSIHADRIVAHASHGPSPPRTLLVHSCAFWTR